jgi:N4-gp56 family major capsid protein
MGKQVAIYEYLPFLDDRNINSQGIDANGITIVNGNLYGSSRDVGNILGKLPFLGEAGGVVNGVGFTRITHKSSLRKLGKHFSYTQDALNFDTDEMWFKHVLREGTNGANQVSEALLQIDLLNGAGTVLYAGIATSKATVTGQVTPAAGGVPELPASIVNYDNFIRLEQILTNAQCPIDTTIVKGTDTVDTVTLDAARIMYVGNELVPLLRRMSDSRGDAVFMPVNKYAANTKVLRGEVGQIGQFKIIQVPEMLHYAGQGATASANVGYRATTVAGVSKYDVYPMLVVGEDSFASLSFVGLGGAANMNIITKMPGKDTATLENDPYGQKGFTSFQWFQGTLIFRPERIALIYTVAPL